MPMTRLALLLLLLVSISPAAFAQDGAAPPGQAAGSDAAAPAPAEAAGSDVAAPAPAPRYELLTPRERELLREGEMETGRLVAGGAVGTMFGYGLGHAVQGRFLERGWIFLVGETAATGMAAYFFLSCLESAGVGFPPIFGQGCENQFGWFVGATVTMAVFRTWEIADVWLAPVLHNDRVRRARRKAGRGGYGLYLSPTLGNEGPSGGVAGLSLRF